MNYNDFVMNIKRQYIVDEQNRRVAVQVDIKTFEQIEEVLENYALSRLMKNAAFMYTTVPSTLFGTV